MSCLSAVSCSGVHVAGLPVVALPCTSYVCDVSCISDAWGAALLVMKHINSTADSGTADAVE
jgi:hypothetical protein